MLTIFMRQLLWGLQRDGSRDDANLPKAMQIAARRLYKLGYIDAIPLEGSDAPVEVLSITQAGEDALWAEGGEHGE